MKEECYTAGCHNKKAEYSDVYCKRCVRELREQGIEAGDHDHPDFPERLKNLKK